jgi:ribosomal protein L20
MDSKFRNLWVLKINKALLKTTNEYHELQILKY